MASRRHVLGEKMLSRQYEELLNALLFRYEDQFEVGLALILGRHKHERKAFADRYGYNVTVEENNG